MEDSSARTCRLATASCGLKPDQWALSSGDPWVAYGAMIASSAASTGMPHIGHPERAREEQGVQRRQLRSSKLPGLQPANGIWTGLHCPPRPMPLARYHPRGAETGRWNRYRSSLRTARIAFVAAR